MRNVTQLRNNEKNSVIFKITLHIVIIPKLGYKNKKRNRNAKILFSFSLHKIIFLMSAYVQNATNLTYIRRVIYSVTLRVSIAAKCIQLFFYKTKVSNYCTIEYRLGYINSSNCSVGILSKYFWCLVNSCKLCVIN